MSTINTADDVANSFDSDSQTNKEANADNASQQTNAPDISVKSLDNTVKSDVTSRIQQNFILLELEKDDNR